MRAIFSVVVAAFVVSVSPGGALSQATEELIGEGCLIPDTPPFQCPVKYAATFSHDEGVYFSSGEPLKRVWGMPDAGQYSAAAGLYVFNAADHGKGVLISYTFSPPSRQR